MNVTKPIEQLDRDKAQEVIIEAAKASGYADSTQLDARLKHELADRIATAISAARAEVWKGCPHCSCSCVECAPCGSEIAALEAAANEGVK